MENLDTDIPPSEEAMEADPGRFALHGESNTKEG